VFFYILALNEIKDGRTAVEEAMKYGHKEVVKGLLLLFSIGEEQQEETKLHTSTAVSNEVISLHIHDDVL